MNIQNGTAFYFKGAKDERTGFCKVIQIDNKSIILKFDNQRLSDPIKVKKYQLNEFLDLIGKQYQTIEQYENEYNAILNHLVTPEEKLKLQNEH